MPKSMTLLIAVSVIFIGVMLLLGNMGVIPNNVMALWPVILIVSGLVGLTCFDPQTRSMLPKKSSKKKK